MHKMLIRLVVTGCVLAALTVALGVAAQDRKSDDSGTSTNRRKGQTSPVDGESAKKTAKIPARKTPKGTDNAAARGNKDPEKMTAKEIDKMIKFAELVCGEARTIGADGSIKIASIMCEVPSRNDGGDSKSTDESGDDSSKDGGGGDSGGDQGSGGGDSGGTSTERGKGPRIRSGLPEQFRTVPAGDIAEVPTGGTARERKPRRPGGSSGTLKGREDSAPDPDGGNSGGDTGFGPTILMGKDGGADKSDWEYLGSYQNENGERVEVWGDPLSKLGEAFGRDKDGKPPAGIDEPTTTPKGKPKGGKPKDDKPKKK